MMKLRNWFKRIFHGWTVSDVAAVAIFPEDAARLIWQKVPFDFNANGSYLDDCSAYEALMEELFSIKGWCGYRLNLVASHPYKRCYVDGKLSEFFNGHTVWCWYNNAQLWYADNQSKGAVKVLDNHDILLRCEKWIGYVADISGVYWNGRWNGNDTADYRCA